MALNSNIERYILHSNFIANKYHKCNPDYDLDYMNPNIEEFNVLFNSKEEELYNFKSVDLSPGCLEKISNIMEKVDKTNINLHENDNFDENKSSFIKIPSKYLVDDRYLPIQKKALEGSFSSVSKQIFTSNY